eukprot:365315-Chlamydomonas_euryale.AAC.3
MLHAPWNATCQIPRPSTMMHAKRHAARAYAARQAAALERRQSHSSRAALASMAGSAALASMADSAALASMADSAACMMAHMVTVQARECRGLSVWLPACPLDSVCVASNHAPAMQRGV